jgi:glycosyltransferase involved in cell wall biosynthesis
MGRVVTSASSPLRLGVVGARGLGNFQGGIETYCSSLYPLLPQEKFEVTLFVSRTPAGANAAPVRVRRVPSLRMKTLETVITSFAAVLAARVEGIRVLHVHGIGACLSLPVARLLGIRTVVRHMGADYHRAKWGRLAKFVLRLGEICAARFAESVVCLNQDIANQFARATGRTTQVYVVPNAVSGPRGATDTDILARLGVQSNQYVLAVGRLVPEKNQDQLIDAFRGAALPADARLVIVGQADYPSAYSRRLRILAEKDSRVVLAGNLFGSDLWMLYRRCRVYALPSAHEGMSFSLLEAAIAGATIIASDIPANVEVCRGFGRMFPVGSSSALAEALAFEWARVRPEGEVQEQIAVCAREHDWKAVAEKMEAIFLAVSPAHSRTGLLLALEAKDRE